MRRKLIKLIINKILFTIINLALIIILYITIIG
jgi:hypothetical protein